MPGENQEGLVGATKESSSVSHEELFSGSLESPKGDDSKSTESPKVEPEAKVALVDSGKSSSEPEDSELAGIFTDLEKDIPEALKNHASNVKKKLQGYFTTKNQKISKELEILKSNQITDELKRDYSTLYGWYDKIQKNPQLGLRELASSLGISVEALVNSSEAGKPVIDELTPDKLVTAEDYAAFARQEARKAVEEIRDREVKPLKSKIENAEAASVQRENVQRGFSAIEEAKRLPGFASEDGKLTAEGQEAINSVLRGEFYGPKALNNAFKAIMADKINETSAFKVKSLEEQLVAMRAGIHGASPIPGGNTPKTKTISVSTEDAWDRMMSEPLSS